MPRAPASHPCRRGGAISASVVTDSAITTSTSSPVDDNKQSTDTNPTPTPPSQIISSSTEGHNDEQETVTLPHSLPSGENAGSECSAQTQSYDDENEVGNNQPTEERGNVETREDGYEDTSGCVRFGISFADHPAVVAARLAAEQRRAAAKEEEKKEKESMTDSKRRGEGNYEKAESEGDGLSVNASEEGRERFGISLIDHPALVAAILGNKTGN